MPEPCPLMGVVAPSHDPVGPVPQGNLRAALVSSGNPRTLTFCSSQKAGGTPEFVVTQQLEALGSVPE